MLIENPFRNGLTMGGGTNGLIGKWKERMEGGEWFVKRMEERNGGAGETEKRGNKRTDKPPSIYFVLKFTLIHVPLTELLGKIKKFRYKYRSDAEFYVALRGSSPVPKCRVNSLAIVQLQSW